MNIKTFKLTEEELILKIGSFQDLRIKFPNINIVPFEMVVEAFGKRFYFADFADYYVYKNEKGKPQAKPEVTTVIKEIFHPFCALIGHFQVVFINLGSNLVDKILEFYRKETEDEGFYRLDIKTRENYFLLIYESGVAKVSDDGNVEYHKSLRWDDLYIKSDDRYLYYSSEYRQEGDEWRLDIDTGITVSGW